jgi:hypothetical protein
MDPNLIYVKTASGESAVQQRTIVIQRNVRMVLILVDGQSSVADLTHKTGNLQLTENALTELEKGGFVELKQDSLLSESLQVAHEIRSSAIEKAMRLSSKEANHGKRPNLEQSESPLSTLLPALDETEMLSESEIKRMNTPISLNSEFFDAKDEVDFSASRFSLPSDMDISGKPISAKDAAKGKKHGKKGNSPVSKPSLLARLKSMWSSRADRVPDDKPIKIKPVRYKARGGTSWTTWAFLGLVGVLVLGCAATLLFPLNFLAPDLETAFSFAIGRPVSIQEVRVNAYPEPGLILGDVQLGQGSQVIRIREIKLQPDPTSLFSERRRLRKVVVSGTEFQLERISEMPAIFATLSDPNRSPKIGAILFQNTDISFGRLVLRNMEAQIQRDPADKMQALVARTIDKSLTLTAEPIAAIAKGIELTVEAFSWPNDVGSRFFSNSLNFKGRLEKDTMTISGLEIRIFDGLIKGDAIVHAGDMEPNLAGTVVFERIDASRLGESLGIGKKLAGSIAGSMQFTANSKTWPTILSSVNGSGEFSIQRGSFYGFDLANVVRHDSGVPLQGGSTNFDQMSGRMRLTPEKSQFYNLNIALGLMQSTGYVDLTKEDRLSGRMELLMKGSVNQIRIPVIVSGTLNSSVVQSVGR